MQGTVSYRVTDPVVAATRLDFSVDPGTGAWRSDPLAAVGSLLTELAQQHVLDLVAQLDLREAMSATASVRAQPC